MSILYQVNWCSCTLGYSKVREKMRCSTGCMPGQQNCWRPTMGKTRNQRLSKPQLAKGMPTEPVLSPWQLKNSTRGNITFPSRSCHLPLWEPLPRGAEASTAGLPPAAQPCAWTDRWRLQGNQGRVSTGPPLPCKLWPGAGQMAAKGPGNESTWQLPAADWSVGQSCRGSVPPKCSCSVVLAADAGCWVRGRPYSPTVHWSYGPLVLRPTGPTAHWSYGPLVLRPIGPTVRPIGPTAHWSYGPLVLRPTGPTVHWSYGPLVLRSTGPTAHWSYGPLVLRPTGPRINGRNFSFMSEERVSTKPLWPTSTPTAHSPDLISSHSGKDDYGRYLSKQQVSGLPT